MGHGGKRAGAGRPKKDRSDARPQHQMRAYWHEWRIIKPFADIVKLGYGHMADKALQNLISELDEEYEFNGDFDTFEDFYYQILDEIRNAEIEKKKQNLR